MICVNGGSRDVPASVSGDCSYVPVRRANRHKRVDKKISFGQRPRIHPSESRRRQLPAEPVGERASHHQLEITTLEPRHLLGEHGHALTVRAGMRVMSVPQNIRSGPNASYIWRMYGWAWTRAAGGRVSRAVRGQTHAHLQTKSTAESGNREKSPKLAFEPDERSSPVDLESPIPAKCALFTQLRRESRKLKTGLRSAVNSNSQATLVMGSFQTNRNPFQTTQARVG